MSSLVIYGASYLEPLKVLAAINRQHPTWEVHGFVDDALPPGQLVAGLPVLGGAEVLPELVRSGHQFFHNVGGKPQASVQVAQKMRAAACPLVSLIHPRVDVFGVTLGENCFVPEGCILAYGARLGDFVACRFGVIVSHDVVVGSHVSLSVRATLAGHTQIEDECFIGASSTVVRARVGRGSVVGAGAVVLQDVVSGSTVVGVPARPVRAKL